MCTVHLVHGQHRLTRRKGGALPLHLFLASVLYRLSRQNNERVVSPSQTRSSWPTWWPPPPPRPRRGPRPRWTSRRRRRGRRSYCQVGRTRIKKQPPTQTVDISDEEEYKKRDIPALLFRGGKGLCPLPPSPQAGEGEGGGGGETVNWIMGSPLPLPLSPCIYS